MNVCGLVELEKVSCRAKMSRVVAEVSEPGIARLAEDPPNTLAARTVTRAAGVIVIDGAFVA